MIPKEDREEAYNRGYNLGLNDTNYRRDWGNPYLTGKARWAMVDGYEAAWYDKRNPRPKIKRPI